MRYAEAATHFANAAAVFPPNSAYEDKRIGYLTREANALYRQGSELGENDALRGSIGRFKKLVEMTPRARVPRAWISIQNSLGVALERLGEREGGPTTLEEAVLQEATRERGPLQWASIQKNLGFALHRLGEREAGTAKLEEAVFGFREALKERTRERVPLEWAATQNDLGLALWRLGEREAGPSSKRLSSPTARRSRRAPVSACRSDGP